MNKVNKYINKYGVVHIYLISQYRLSKSWRSNRATQTITFLFWWRREYSILDSNWYSHIFNQIYLICLKKIYLFFAIWCFIRRNFYGVWFLHRFFVSNPFCLEINWTNCNVFEEKIEDFDEMNLLLFQLINPIQSNSNSGLPNTAV